MVDAARHEQVDVRGSPREGYGCRVGIVVPEGGEHDVPSLGGEAERHTYRCHDGVAIVGEEFAQPRVVDVDRELGMAPFAHSLCGELEGGDVGTRREIAVAEDVGHARVVCAVDAHRLAPGTLDSCEIGGKGLDEGLGVRYGRLPPYQRTGGHLREGHGAFFATVACGCALDRLVTAQGDGALARFGDIY